MIDLSDQIEKLKTEYHIINTEFMFDVSTFFVSNQWFGTQPEVTENGRILMEDAQFERCRKSLEEFCQHYDCNEEEKNKKLIEKLKQQLPATEAVFRRYCKDVGLETEAANKVLDFLLYFLPGELETSTDQEIASLMSDGFDHLPKIFGDILADFINWTRVHCKTFYYRDYFMNPHSTNSENEEAYDPDDYLKIIFHMFNENYIAENDMYAKAATSKNFVDTWLFISIHFISVIRNTDIVRIPHPKLTMTPGEVLERVQDGSFEDVDARLTLYSVLYRLSVLQLTPSKTQGTTGVASIKFHVPESVEVHFGKLFAVAEAFHQISGLPEDRPLIRTIATYEQISRYMGEEIGELFLESNFRSRSANKAFMQMIYVLTDDILENDDQFSVKGYMLAALARSHKGSYGEFAKTTSVYLRDAKMSGFSPEFVARELFERGVLSFIPSTLLKILAGKEYQKLSLHTQTKLIQELNLTPSEVERSVGLAQMTMERAVKTARELYAAVSPKDILLVLHRIGAGEAVSKQDETLCLITACGKVCPYTDRTNCISCQYEISTKSTMWLMISEVNRLKALYKKTENIQQKKKHIAILKEIILPTLDEILHCIEETYGTKVKNDFEQIIREVNDEYSRKNQQV